MANCLSLNPQMKQCLLAAGHGGDHQFTLLQPERAAEADRRKERDNQLVRRNLAVSFIPKLLEFDNESKDPKESVKDVVFAALALADELIASTGGFGP